MLILRLCSRKNLSLLLMFVFASPTYSSDLGTSLLADGIIKVFDVLTSQSHYKGKYKSPPSSIVPLYTDDGVYFIGISGEHDTPESAIASSYTDVYGQMLQHAGIESIYAANYLSNESSRSVSLSNQVNESTFASNFLSITKVEERYINKTREGKYESWLRVFIGNNVLVDMQEWSEQVRTARLDYLKNPYHQVTGTSSVSLGGSTKHYAEKQALRLAKLDAFANLSEAKNLHVSTSSVSSSGRLTKDTMTTSCRPSHRGVD